MHSLLFLLFDLLLVVGYTNAAKGPNVLLIMSDDQDLHLDSMSVMPHVTSLIGKQGVQYNKHYCTVAWCCPSRVNFFTGQAAHNTNVTGLNPPYGGWPKFADQGLNDNYLPVWLNESGIRTYYVGKFLNSYGRRTYATPEHPKGWTGSSFLMDPCTYNYYHSCWISGYNSNKDFENYPGVHTTLVTQHKALKMLDEAASTGDQFFMMVAPVAPHVEIAGHAKPPPPPPMFKDKFLTQQAPRTPNFNPDEPSGASWVKALPKLKQKDIAACDTMQVHRLQNIAGVDYMVSKLMEKLQKHNLLDNTYVIYTSDNGFHIGNHRMHPGKRCGYEEDINIPLLIRGPNVPKGVQSEISNSHTDMAPTLLQMMGVAQRPDFDGQALAYTQSALDNSNKHEHVNVEFWDAIDSWQDGNKQTPTVNGEPYYNATYKSLRFRDDENSFYYSVWCTNEHEFYDMSSDQYQMENRLASHNKAVNSNTKYYGRPEKQLWNRLDTMLMVLKGCKQDSCRNVWDSLFAKGVVGSLEAAMDAKYDGFFAGQPKVSFSQCIGGHIPSLEGPQSAESYAEFLKKHPKKGGSGSGSDAVKGKGNGSNGDGSKAKGDPSKSKDGGTTEHKSSTSKDESTKHHESSQHEKTTHHPKSSKHPSSHHESSKHHPTGHPDHTIPRAWR